MQKYIKLLDFLHLESFGQSVCEETYRVLGSWLDMRFMQKPLLIKLLHHQGYACTLPLTSETIHLIVKYLPSLEPHIPSLHVALDWIPELLSSANPENRIFAGCLASTFYNSIIRCSM